MQRKEPLPRTWPHEESGDPPHRPQMLGEVLDAVSALNDQVLEALSGCARSSNGDFPLPHSVQGFFAALSHAQRRTLARCGVVLADAEFRNEALWRRVAILGEAETQALVAREWISSGESVVLSYSVLMVAWYIVHTVPAAAGVLLGMSEAVLEEFRSLGVGQLAMIARQRPNGIRPRWVDRPDVWLDLLSAEEPSALRHANSVSLRCLTASAACAPTLLASLDVVVT